MFNWLINKKLKDEFAEHIIEHVDSLYNTALAMTRAKEDAEDLVQEAVLRAYRNFGKFEKGTNFKAWIITILRNIYINNYRKKKKEPAKVGFQDVENFVSFSEVSGIEEEIFSETMKTAIEKLPDEMRTTLNLFYGENFSYKEIAQIMDVPIGTVMSRLHNGRQILKRHLFSLGIKKK